LELQSPSVPVEKSSCLSTAGKGEGRLPVFLTEVVAHFDREWQHLDK
jgi:hypothetical protein